MRKVIPYLTLDAWRGIAAIWVVMFHASCPFIGGGHEDYISQPLYAASVWGQLGVTMFFVISGYCITGAAYSVLSSNKGMVVYGKDRVRRIYPPYLAALAVSVALGGLAVLLHKDLCRIDQYPLHEFLFWLSIITLTHVEAGYTGLLSGVSWTLCYKVVFYAIIGVLLWLSMRSSRTDRIQRWAFFQWGVFCVTLVSLVWMVLSPYKCPFPLNEWYKFGLGSLLFLRIAAVEDRNENSTAYSCRMALLFLLTASLLALLMAFLHGSYESPEGLVPHFVLGHASKRVEATTSVFFVIVLWLLRPFDDRISRAKMLWPLMLAGTFSYSLYLTHMLFLPVILARMTRLGFDGSLYWITLLSAIVITMILGWAFYSVVESHFISSRQKRRMESELSGVLSAGQPSQNKF